MHVTTTRGLQLEVPSRHCKTGMATKTAEQQQPCTPNNALHVTCLASQPSGCGNHSTGRSIRNTDGTSCTCTCSWGRLAAQSHRFLCCRQLRRPTSAISQPTHHQEQGHRVKAPRAVVPAAHWHKLSRAVCCVMGVMMRRSSWRRKTCRGATPSSTVNPSRAATTTYNDSATTATTAAAAAPAARVTGCPDGEGDMAAVTGVGAAAAPLAIACLQRVWWRLPRSGDGNSRELGGVPCSGGNYCCCGCPR